MHNLILASSSPRRQDLLKKIGITRFAVEPPEIDETPFKNEKPSVTICHTIKGKGFYFAENNPLWHHKNSFTTEEIKNLNESLR